MAGEFECPEIQIGHITLLNSRVFRANTFIAKYSSDGIAQWAHRIAGSSARPIIALSDAGNLYMSGYFENELIFNDTVRVQPNSDVQNAYLAKYDSSGNVKWAKHDGVYYTQTY